MLDEWHGELVAKKRSHESAAPNDIAARHPISHQLQIAAQYNLDCEIRDTVQGKAHLNISVCKSFMAK